MYHMYKILSYLHINGKHENGFCALKGCCSGVIGYAYITWVIKQIWSLLFLLNPYTYKSNRMFVCVSVCTIGSR